MLTKGIVSKIYTQKYNNITYYKYSVILPLLGMTAKSECVSSLAPGLSYKLHQGDIVFVECEDMKLDNGVITGMPPKINAAFYKGSSQTESKIAINNADEIIFDKNGEAVLPKNTKIKIDTSDNLIYYGDNKNFVDTSELKNLIGLNKNLGQFIAKTESSINKLNEKFQSLQVTLTVKKSVFDNLTVSKNIFLSNPELQEIGKKIIVYVKKENNIFTIKINNEEISRNQLKIKYGISFSDMLDEEGYFIAQVESGILPIKYGGTGCSTQQEFIDSLNIRYVEKYATSVVDQLLDLSVISSDTADEIARKAADITIIPGEVENTIYNFLTKTVNMTCEQACGILGNIKQECNMNPASQDANGYGGIIGFSYGMADALKAFANRMGLPWTDLRAQLAFLVDPANGSYAKFTYGNEWNSAGAKSKAFQYDTEFYPQNSIARGWVTSSTYGSFDEFMRTCKASDNDEINLENSCYYFCNWTEMDSFNSPGHNRRNICQYWNRLSYSQAYWRQYKK